VPNVKKILGLNPPGTPWATSASWPYLSLCPGNATWLCT